jgi:hypothetical protein
MGREHHFDPIARQEPQKIPNLLSTRMGQNLVPVIQLHPIDAVWRLFNHPGLYGRVRTQGPFSVTATQCSKCAE